MALRQILGLAYLVLYVILDTAMGMRGDGSLNKSKRNCQSMGSSH